MIIVWGSNMYGRCDEVPGMFHVATRFGHLWYLPLIPMGSYLVYRSEGRSFQGMPIGFHFKSFAMAWLRTGMVVGAIVFTVMAIAMACEQRPHHPTMWWIPALMAVACGALGAWFSYGKFFRHASYITAVKLSEKAKFNDEGKVMIELKFGNISEQEAMELIEVARSQPTGIIPASPA
jgi:hypothetical protein